MTAEPNAPILGIGNVLWADEGSGVGAVEEMAPRHRFGPQVRLLDGGTQGVYLADQVPWAEILVVFDAVDYGLAPGTLNRVEGEEVPRLLGVRKMSLHQTGFQEVPALAALLGDYARHLLLVGVQPVELDDFGGSLRPAVRAQMDLTIALALDHLAGLGIRPLPGPAGSTAGADLPHPSLALARYEAGRLSPPRVPAAWATPGSCPGSLPRGPDHVHRYLHADPGGRARPPLGLLRRQRRPPPGGHAAGRRPPGGVLVFLGAAREPLEQAYALRIRDALAALHVAAAGDAFDHLFPDLIGREPQLPEHLRRA